MHAKAITRIVEKQKELLGLKIHSYPEFFTRTIQNKDVLSLAVPHGKQTITSMILHVMHFHNIGS
jgi:UDP-N-acetylmuramate: L-alanyl-gamma-D-glutamyl-meso-diaminopimelate ligase